MDKEQIERKIFDSLDQFALRIKDNTIDVSKPPEKGKNGYKWIVESKINEDFNLKIELSRKD